MIILILLDTKKAPSLTFLLEIGGAVVVDHSMQILKNVNMRICRTNYMNS